MPFEVVMIDEVRYHKVSQKNSEEGICCSVNYCKLRLKCDDDGEIEAHMLTGYDMDFDGLFHATNKFVRNMAWAVLEGHKSQ